MKKFLLSLSILVSSLTFAQVGAVAPNFTQTDLNGVEHDLYSYLDAGKVVIVDMSATWCGPCWNFHQAHYLKDLYEEFGAPGTNEVVIIFYEDAANTTDADLYGTGNNTLGDWVTGVPYPIINATQVLPAEYGKGYPTISVICPSDKKIKYTLGGSLESMRANVQATISECSTASIEENAVTDFSIAPNPVNEMAKLNFTLSTANVATVSVYSLSGKLMYSSDYSVVAGVNSIDLNLSSLEAGSYIVRVDAENTVSVVRSIVKK